MLPMSMLAGSPFGYSAPPTPPQAQAEAAAPQISSAVASNQGIMVQLNPQAIPFSMAPGVYMVALPNPAYTPPPGQPPLQPVAFSMNPQQAMYFQQQLQQQGGMGALPPGFQAQQQHPSAGQNPAPTV